MEEKPSLKLHLAALAGVALFVLAAYLPVTAGGRVVYSQDTTDLNYVLVRSHVNDLRAQGFTAWCPGLGLGFYRPSDPTLGLYSPRVLLYFLFDGYGAQLTGIVVYALLAGFGAYLLGLRLGGPTAGFFLGVSWPLCGVMASTVTNIPYFASAAWLPFAAWAWLKPAGRRWAASGFFAGMVAIDGDLFGLAFIIAALGSYSLIAPRADRRAEIIEAAAAGLLAVGIAAIVWLPALAALPDSGRAGGMTVGEATAFSLHPLRIANLIGPRIFGQPEEGSFWRLDISTSLMPGGFWFATVYLGFFAPLLAVLGLKTDRRRTGALIAVALIFTVFAFGRHNPLVPRLIEAFPALALFRYPAKLFTFAALMLLAAASVGANTAGRVLSDPITRRRATMAAGIYGGLGLAVLLTLAGDAGDAIKTTRAPSLAYVRIYQDLIRTAVFVVGGPVLVWFLGGRPRTFGLAVCLVAGFDLLIAAPVISTNPRADMDRPSAIAAAINKLGPGRTLLADDIYYYLHAGPRTAIKQNWGILDGLAYALGKTATLPARIEALNDRNVFRDQGRELFRLLAVRYVFDHLDPGGSWRKKLEADGTLVSNQTWPDLNVGLFVTPEPNPRIEFFSAARPASDRTSAFDSALKETDTLFIATDSALLGGKPVTPAPELPAATAAATGQIVLEEPRRDELIVGVRSEGPGWLLVRDRLTRGWSAWVDDEMVPVWYGDGFFRAVRVPAGWHEVRFAFRPPRLGLGALITLLSLAVAATLPARRFIT